MTKLIAVAVFAALVIACDKKVADVGPSEVAACVSTISWEAMPDTAGPHLTVTTKELVEAAELEELQGDGSWQAFATWTGTYAKIGVHFDHRYRMRGRVVGCVAWSAWHEVAVGPRNECGSCGKPVPVPEPKPEPKPDPVPDPPHCKAQDKDGPPCKDKLPRRKR